MVKKVELISWLRREDGRELEDRIYLEDGRSVSMRYYWFPVSLLVYAFYRLRGYKK